MKIHGTVRTKCRRTSEKLNGLEFAAELQLEHIADREFICRIQRHCLQCGIVQVGVGGCETADRESHRRARTIGQTVGVHRPQNCRGKAVSVTDISTYPDTVSGE